MPPLAFSVIFAAPSTFELVPLVKALVEERTDEHRVRLLAAQVA